MKKISVAILALLYITVSSGIAISIHYCMGKIASVDLISKSDKCGKCGMKLTDGCCQDEFKMVKLSDSHKLISNDIKIESPVATIHYSKSFYSPTFFSPGIPFGYSNHSPPGVTGISLNVLYCVFRI